MNIIDYFKGYNEGHDKGVKDTIKEVVDIVNMSDYPEDLEMYICDWLEDKGVKM